MTSPRDMLNRLKWESSGGSLAGVRIIILHRGAPHDRTFIQGKDILAVGRSFLDLPRGVRIPHHRILGIERDDELVWQRRVNHAHRSTSHHGEIGPDRASHAS